MPTIMNLSSGVWAHGRHVGSTLNNHPLSWTPEQDRLTYSGASYEHAKAKMVASQQSALVGQPLERPFQKPPVADAVHDSWATSYDMRADQQEGVPNVLVGEAAVQGDLHVHDLGDGVHKLHHLLLQHLCGICELPDVAEAEDCIHLQPGRFRFSVSYSVVSSTPGRCEHLLSEWPWFSQDVDVREVLLVRECKAADLLPRKHCI